MLRSMLQVLTGAASAALLCFGLPLSASAQDWVKTGTNLGAQRIRIAAIVG